MILIGYLRGRYFGVKLSYNDIYYLIRNYNLRSDFLRGYKSIEKSTDLTLKKALELYNTGLDLNEIGQYLNENPEKSINEITIELFKN